MWGAGKRARVTILLVDYEKDFARTLKIRLKGAGYGVVLAFDSIQGIVMAKRTNPN
jgi:DNA-binding response OmpR family regulator